MTLIYGSFDWWIVGIPKCIPLYIIFKALNTLSLFFPFFKFNYRYVLGKNWHRQNIRDLNGGYKELLYFSRNSFDLFVLCLWGTFNWSLQRSICSDHPIYSNSPFGNGSLWHLSATGKSGNLQSELFFKHFSDSCWPIFFGIGPLSMLKVWPHVQSNFFCLAFSFLTLVVLLVVWLSIVWLLVV